jgi:DNA-binding beta-propeller fold protein YncE
MDETGVVALPVEPGRVVLSPDGARAYVMPGFSQDGPLVVVDTAGPTVVGSVAATGINARGAAVSPDGRTVYRLSLAAACVVDVIDAAGLTVASSITLPVRGMPGDLCLSPDGGRLHVVTGDDAGGGQLRTVDLASGTVVSTTEIGFDPDCVVVSPDGRTVWAFPTGDATVLLDTATATTTFARGGFTGNGVRMAFTPDGRRAYQTNRFESPIWVMDPATTVEVGAVDAVLTTDVVVTPDGRHAIVGDRRRGALRVLDTGTDQPLAPPLELGFAPQGLAVSPDGSHLHLTGSGSLRVVDLASVIG